MSSNISVESRVKAHISTPYIDADGRGTRETYAKDFATCMLDPAEFRAREAGDGPEQQLLQTLERTEASLTMRNEFKSMAIRADVAALTAKTNAAAADEQADLEERRAEARAAGREADAASHFTLYQKRNESAMAMMAFEDSLKPSSEALVRDREEAISKRHRELVALRQRANMSQTQAIQHDTDRRTAAEALGEAMLAKKLSEQAELDRKELLEKAREEYEAIVTERERQTQIRRLEADVKLKKDVQFLMWAHDRDEALATAQRMAATATAAQQEVHEAEMAAHAALSIQSYGEMKALHAKLEALCAELGKAILKVNKHGSCLEMLMAVAKEKAVARGKAYHGLTAVCKGSYAPTVYTPTVLPQPDKMAVTVASQTNVTEPIRPSSKPHGRRI